MAMSKDDEYAKHLLFHNISGALKMMDLKEAIDLVYGVTEPLFSPKPNLGGKSSGSPAGRGGSLIGGGGNESASS
jgi:hypothetical protein